MSEVRKRTTAADTNGQAQAVNGKQQPSQKKASGGERFRVTDALRILGGLLLLNCALSYFVTNSSVTWGWRPWFSKPGNIRAWWSGPLRLTDQELLQYDGTDPSKPIYLALNGTIYDVSAGAHMYGPGGSYHFFAGRDAARAFVTGCFDTDLTPDLRGAELTYVPVDDDEGEEVGAGEGELKRKGGAKGVSKAELKMRRERDLRLGRKSVKDTIDGWSKMFRGESGKNYFKVGEVKREPGWLEKLPKRELCQRAQEGRPKRKE